MKAMILAAGFGTRLRPLTRKKPKALIPVLNTPMISRSIDLLKVHGATRIIVNAHHHHRQITDYLDNGRPFGLVIDVRVEPEILGTGGGIKNCTDFWDNNPFIVINSDILTDIDLTSAYIFHKKMGSIATLILHDCHPFNQVKINKSHYITEISSQISPGNLAFTGIHIIDPELLSHIPKASFSNIIDTYRQLIQSGYTISAYISKGHYWRDIGNIKSYCKAHLEILRRGKRDFSTGTEIDMAPSAKLKKWAVLGENVCLEKDVEITRSILWDNVRIKKGIEIKDSIVTCSRVVDHDLIKEIY